MDNCCHCHDDNITNGFTRYTTPTQKLIVEGASLVGTEVFVTYKQGRISETFSGAEIEVEEELIQEETTDENENPSTKETVNTIILVYISQEKSSRFKEGAVKIQVNWTIDDKRYATTTEEVFINDNLLQEVL